MTPKKSKLDPWNDPYQAMNPSQPREIKPVRAWALIEKKTNSLVPIEQTDYGIAFTEQIFEPVERFEWIEVEIRAVTQSVKSVEMPCPTCEDKGSYIACNKENQLPHWEKCHCKMGLGKEEANPKKYAKSPDWEWAPTLDCSIPKMETTPTGEGEISDSQILDWLIEASVLNDSEEPDIALIVSERAVKSCAGTWKREYKDAVRAAIRAAMKKESNK